MRSVAVRAQWRHCWLVQQVRAPLKNVAEFFHRCAGASSADSVAQIEFVFLR
jgi:hypothetical protein